MTAKRLALVGLFTLATLVGAPRPAQAQWMEFMRWLSSLDPGPFGGPGVAVSLTCFKEDTRSGQVSWDFKPLCISADPEKTTRSYVTLSGGQLYGKANLDFGKGNDETRIAVFHLAGNFAYRVARGVDVGGAVGWAKFGGSNANSQLVQRLTLEPFAIIWPVKALNPKNGDKWWGHFAVRAQYTSFPQGFTPQDFGAISGSSSMNGSEEGLWGYQIIYAIRYR